MINAKMLGMLVAAFAAGTFIASPLPAAIAAVIATDVQCAGCVGTSDLAGNAVTAAKIKDGEVKAPEIATDAVGAAELQGVTKLIFAKCVPSSAEQNISDPPGTLRGFTCNISGVASGDQVIATFTKPGGNPCFAITSANANSGVVHVVLTNICENSETYGAGSFISLIVYHK